VRIERLESRSSNAPSSRRVPDEIAPLQQVTADLRRDLDRLTTRLDEHMHAQATLREAGELKTSDALKSVRTTVDENKSELSGKLQKLGDSIDRNRYWVVEAREKSRTEASGTGLAFAIDKLDKEKLPGIEVVVAASGTKVAQKHRFGRDQITFTLAGRVKS
jgi:hypothetical protein